MIRTALYSIVALLALYGAPQARASTLFSQGFETDTSGWSDSGIYGTLTRVASGTNGITSSSGSFHAIAEQNTRGPYSTFNGVNDGSTFPGTVIVSLDIFLDTGWAAGEGFDYSGAFNYANGGFMQDFIFHVTQDTSTGDLLVGAGNTTTYDPSEDLETGDHAVISSSGWYTFEHRFFDDGGVFSGEMTVSDSLGNVLFSASPGGGDPIATAGEARYSWFTNIDIAGGVAIDNSSLTHVPEPGSLTLLGLGCLGVVPGMRRRRKRTAETAV